MLNFNLYRLVIVVVAVAMLFGSPMPASSQMYPTERSADQNTGNTGTVPPPNVGTFVRQDPMPENLQDVTVYTSDNKGISLEVTFPDVFDYEFAEDSGIKHFRRYKANSGFKVIGNVGEPEILQRILWLQVPHDAVDVKIESAEPSLKGEPMSDVALYPIPEIVFERNAEGVSIGKEVFTMNEEFYQKDELLPQESAQIMEESFKQDMHLVRVAVPVMTYNPKTSTVQEIKSVKINLIYSSQSTENTVTLDTEKDPFHKVFNALVPNYAHSKPKPTESIEAGVMEIRGNDLTNPHWAQENNFFPDYLVIAAEAFDDPQSVLQTWAQHRAFNETGGHHRIAIAYADEIAQAYPNQGLKEEKNKAFIEMVYNNWRILEQLPSLKFVLLAGDADMGGTYNPWFLPTWRSNPDAKDTGDNDYAWLEGNDEVNDVFLGRLPAKNESELGTMVNKIISFETNPPQGPNHYGTRVMMLYRLEAATVPLYTSDQVRNDLLQRKQEFDEFHNGYLPYYDMFKFNSNKVTNTLNGKGDLFVGYTGHGWKGGWHPDNVNVYDLTNAEKLPAVILSAACETAYFDDFTNYGDSFGEKWLKHEGGGSVCFFGPARSAIWYDWTPEFFSAVHKSNITLMGSSIDVVRMYLTGGDYNDKKIYTLLGDPAIDFSAYMTQSTKGDISVKKTWHTPQFPTYRNQPMTVSAWIENKSNQTVSNVSLKLLSVDAGNLNNAIGQWNITSLPPGAGALKSVNLSYQADSSRFFMAVIDPDNTIEELSKFNNWINYDATYFPIYVDAQNSSGVEHGTSEKPFKDLASAINHAMAKDFIGDGYIVRGMGQIEVHLKKGHYGLGNTIESKSLLLKGIAGAQKTVIYDGLHVVGDRLTVEDLTFDGRKKVFGSAIVSESRPVFSNHDTHHVNTFVRSVFRNWNNDYAVKFERPVITNYQSRYYLDNNIFYNNFGTIRLLDSPSGLQNSLTINNNTFTQNLNNLYLELPYVPSRVVLQAYSNIFWNSGNTTLVGSNPEMASASYNNIDDATFWNIGWADPEHNFTLDPRFKNPQAANFTLKADSPSIDTGRPQEYYNDPDGTRNDQGAYGGPQANMPPIRITYPVHGSTIIAEAGELIPLTIQWNAYKLTPSNYVQIEMYHIKYEQAVPENGGTVYYNGVKVHDIDNVIVPDNGSFSVDLTQENEDESYYLTVRDPFVNIGDFETINFKIMKENSGIRNNR